MARNGRRGVFDLTAMKRLCTLMPLLGVLLLLANPALTSASEKEISRVAAEVSRLNLGFGSYILGRTLTDDQKEKARQTLIEKSLKGTYKFKDGEVHVVATRDADIILGVYKDYPEITRDEVKKLVGSLMFEYGEPTVVAHDKMIFWTYDKHGKINQDMYQLKREEGGAESLATVKFSSSQKLTSVGEKDDAPISAYLMITSNPLSSLFLAYTQQ